MTLEDSLSALLQLLEDITPESPNIVDIEKNAREEIEAKSKELAQRCYEFSAKIFNGGNKKKFGEAFDNLQRALSLQQQDREPLWNAFKCILVTTIPPNPKILDFLNYQETLYCHEYSLYETRALFYYLSSRNDEARKDCKKAIELKSPFFWSEFILGLCDTRERKPSEAERHFFHAIDTMERSGERIGIGRVYHSYGLSLFRQDKYEEARKAFEQGIEAGSRSSVDYEVLASCYSKLGDTDRADEYYKQADVEKRREATVQDRVEQHPPAD